LIDFIYTCYTLNTDRKGIHTYVHAVFICHVLELTVPCQDWEA